MDYLESRGDSIKYRPYEGNALSTVYPPFYLQSTLLTFIQADLLKGFDGFQVVVVCFFRAETLSDYMKTISTISKSQFLSWAPPVTLFLAL